MTIRPGETWGETVRPPAGLVDVDDDAALVEHLLAADGRPVRVLGGDLLRTLGGPPVAGSAHRFPVDLLHVDADGRRYTAVAHVVAHARRTGGWRGPVVAVMNVDRRGAWDIAPRAHPNDGRADVVEVDPSMGLRARWQARRRLPTGTHVPHPAIHTGRTTDRSWQFTPPVALWVDGVERGTVRSLRVVVEPDAAIIHT